MHGSVKQSQRGDTRTHSEVPQVPQLPISRINSEVLSVTNSPRNRRTSAATAVVQARRHAKTYDARCEIMGSVRPIDARVSRGGARLAGP